MVSTLDLGFPLMGLRDFFVEGLGDDSTLGLVQPAPNFQPNPDLECASPGMSRAENAAPLSMLSISSNH